MITTVKILDAFCKSIGLRREKGESLEPILPFFMMDCVYQLYSRFISKLDCKYEAKKYKQSWKRSYNELNSVFFSAFDSNQTDAVLDLMDEFDEYIANYLTISRIAIMDYFKGECDLDRQQVISACLLSEVLCWSAMIVWKRVYEKVGYMVVYDQINRIRKTIHKFLNAWYKADHVIDVSESEKCIASIRTLCRKMIKFLEYKKEK